MQSRGLVTRGKCETDQRDAIIAITPVGTDLTVATAPAHVADVRTALIDHLTEPELHALATLAGEISARLAALANGSSDQPGPRSRCGAPELEANPEPSSKAAGCARGFKPLCVRQEVEKRQRVRGNGGRPDPGVAASSGWRHPRRC
jgi:hypothetical protein